jgi:copper ion binding protein
MATTTFKVTGMSCEHCVRAVTQALQRTDGVTSASVDLQAARATVVYDENKTNPRELASAVNEEGYKAEALV